MDGYLGCFHLLDLMNEAPVNIFSQVVLWIYFNFSSCMTCFSQWDSSKFNVRILKSAYVFSLPLANLVTNIRINTG